MNFRRDGKPKPQAHEFFIAPPRAPATRRFASTESGRFDWIRPHLREAWTVVFSFYSLYLLFRPQVLEVIVKLHGQVAGVPILGYVICCVSGAILLGAYWWFTGKMFTTSTAAEPSALKSPEAEETNRLVIDLCEAVSEVQGLTHMSAVPPSPTRKEWLKIYNLAEKLKKEIAG